MTTTGETQKLPEYVLVSDLHFDSRYQRPLRDAWVDRIASTFDVDAFGCLIVSRRANSGLFVIDGQHRVIALRKMDWNGQRVPALVYDGLDAREEALLFDRYNDQRATSTIERFKAQLFGQVKRAVQLNTIIEKSGYQVIFTGRNPSEKNGLVCIAALYHIADKEGLNMIGEVLTLIRDTWEFERVSKQALFVYGVETFLQAWIEDKNFDRDRFVKACGIASAHKIVTDARERRGNRLSLSMDKSIALTLQRLYETKLSNKKWLRPYDDIERERKAEASRANMPLAYQASKARFAARIDTVRKYLLSVDWTTTEEVSKALDMPINTLRSHLTKLKKELMMEVKREGKYTFFRAGRTVRFQHHNIQPPA